MAYGSELISNGTAEAILENWDNNLVNVYGVSGSRYFSLEANAYMSQNFDTIQFSIGLEEKHYLLEAKFKYDIPLSKLSPKILAQMTLTIMYGDNTLDIFTVPLCLADHLPVTHNNTTWYQVSEKLTVKADSVVTNATIKIDVFSDTTCNLIIDSILVKRSLTDLEVHNEDLNPHNLPLAISIGSFGIKATKDDIVQFWLMDDGAAYFGGTITSDADGVFAGTVFAENIDTSNAKIVIAQIETLIVGDNVTMGPNATITWSKVTDSPDFVDGNDVYTILGENYIITGYINANVIKAGTLDAARIDTEGLYAERLYDPDKSGNYAELGDGNPATDYMDFKIVQHERGTLFHLYDGGQDTQLTMLIDEHAIMNFNYYTEKLYPEGVWDFSAATVIGIDGGGGVSAFLELTDTPTDYVGQEGKIVKVNELATALEFTKDKHEQYLYLTNESIDTITTSVKEYILLADLDEDSHIMVHCILTGTSSVDQIITVTSLVKDIEIYEATYQAKSGLNTFLFECPIWSVEEALGVDIDLKVKTSTGTFIIPVGKLLYWINSVGIIGGIQAVYPVIVISDTISLITGVVNNPTENINLVTQTPVAINLSETPSLLSLTLLTVTENVSLVTETT